MNANPVLLQMKYARVVEDFAELCGISMGEALDFFYHSDEYQLISKGVSDLHCMSDAYLAEDLVEEYRSREMSELQKNMIDYFVICVNEFAKRYNMDAREALLYLDQYDGLSFLEEYYDVQHQLSFDETVDNLATVCHRHGGEI